MTLWNFTGGPEGTWRVRGITAVHGETLAPASNVAVVSGEAPPAPDAAWRLRGAVSNIRYATRSETGTLAKIQPALGRPAATHAALIPIRKTAGWWALPQDERRAIFEETSHHTRIGMDYLPAIARRLHHGRDLGEIFDFVTWFEFAPADEPAFDDLLKRLRATKEWEYVEREVDVRLVRAC
ncbi:MAG: chlorite dismutase family protein [Proteobacteria bacterium]|nr:chlorite dismutase family protein [Pseudomonadota bacterium]